MTEAAHSKTTRPTSLFGFSRLLPTNTESVSKASKSQSLKDWAMAGGGVPMQYKGREHVWHKKVQRHAAGGEVFNTAPDMRDGGDIIEGPAYAEGGEVNMQAGGISKLLQAIKQSKGAYGVRRLERAADEVPNLEKMYTEKALSEAFDGDNAKAVITMKPANFEKYAQVLSPRSKADIGPKMAELAKKGEIDKYMLPTEEYIQHLQRLRQGFDDVPFLGIDKKEYGLPITPFIRGHEGRHRSRALAESGQPTSLVRLIPSAELREPFPRGSQEEYLKALRDELDLTGNLVLPEGRTSAIVLPDIYKNGGAVHMADGGDVTKPYVGYRSAGRRPEKNNDRLAAADMPIAAARGFVSGTLGMPGDLESLVRLPYELITGNESKTLLPTSEDIEKRLPFKEVSDSPAGRAATGIGQIGGGFYNGPGSGARAFMAVPKAVYRAGQDFVEAAGVPASNMAKRAPKGVEPIVVRTPEERAVIEKFGQKQEQEAARTKKVEKAARESASQSPEQQAAKPAKSKGPRVKSEPDIYRKMAEELGDEAVLKAARAGEHLKPTPGGYVGAPRTVTSGQGLGAMRRSMDTDFADSVEAVKLADPERLGTWYDRAKQGIAESVEPYQLPRTLEQHGVYSAGVSPESELTFALKHLNSRVAGEPQMAYRGAGMRNLDEAVAESRPANMGFKIGEYANKNDPRIPNEGLFGVNDFRRAQGMGYTDPQGKPWKAGVSDTMHPFMDAETALQVERANAAGLGGRTDFAGPHIQEVPWVYGKAQDLHSRGLKGRYAGDELEGIKQSLRDANNTARDYFYKQAGSATHEAIPGVTTGHVPSIINAPFPEKVAYGNIGRWDVSAPEYALSDMGTVGAGNRDAIYSALGYRQLPTIEAVGAYFPEGSKIAEHQPVKIARPLLDFPTGGGGIVAEPTRQTMEFAERFRALNDAQAAFGFNLPNTMADVKGKNSLLLDTRKANPKYLDEPYTGVMPDDKQMGALTQALNDTGYGVAPTSRGATIFPFNSKATAEDARNLIKEKGAELQQIYPSEMERSLNTSGFGPGVGMYTPEGFKATEPFSGQATMGLLKEASYLPPEVSMNLGESERVRRQIKDKINRDAALPDARADIQETRRFFSEADWPKAVALIRQGYTPAAALAALGYSASSMAEERR